MNYNNFTHRPSLTSSASSSTRSRLEDAQPSEAINTNTRLQQPPPVIKAHQPPLPSQPRNHHYRGGRGGTMNPSRASSGLPQRPRPQTTAGGWSSSNSTSIGGSNNARGGYKGKERYWGASGANAGGGGANSYSSTPVAIPINPKPKIYVSQLPPSVTEDELRSVFSPYGQM